MKELISVNRRDFIRYSGSLLTASSCMFPDFAEAKARKYKMGLQLFTVRDALARDLTGTIKTIASIGYEDSETYGYDPDQVKYYGLPAASFKQLLTDNQLISTSGHYDFHRYFGQSADTLKRYVDQ